MTYQERTQALLALVDGDRAAKRTAILDAAREQASALVAEAHRRAREHLRTCWREEREHRATRVGAAQAELQTRLRIASQERERALLAMARAQLPEALQQRWADRARRARWADDALADALKVLACGAWRIEHAPGWMDDERRAIASALRAKNVDVAFHELAALRAGLRIVCGATAIDAALDGLVADEDEIGARLLALIEAGS